ncbi:MAG: hypothetical protein ABSG32_19340 [Terriglobia bacterium]
MSRALKPSPGAWVRPFGSRRGPNNRAEKDFDLDPFQIPIMVLYNLVESLLTNRLFALLKGLKLTLNDGATHGALALLVALYASFKRHMEEYQSGWNMVLLGQIDQVFPSRRGHRRGVNHAESIHHKPLFYKEMHQRKGLRVESLVTFVVANMGTRPIR